MNRHIILAVFASVLIGCAKPDKFDLVIQNVGLFDGHQDRGTVNIAINNDTIAEISTKELFSDSLIDGTEKYVIPGLVNAHVHVSTIEHFIECLPFSKEEMVAFVTLACLANSSCVIFSSFRTCVKSSDIDLFI